MEAGSLFGLLAVVLLVSANGFFVAAEFSLVKIRTTRIDQLVAEGKGIAKIVQNEVNHLDSYIAATQLGITLASLALGWVGEPALSHLIEPLLEPIFGSSANSASHTIGVVISFMLITSFHIVLGELVPKTIALQRTEGTAFFVARPLYIFGRVFRPFIMLMNGLGNAIVRMLGLQAGGEHASVHSVEELEMLVTQSREAGVLDNKEEVLLRRVFDFGDKTVNQIMMPRTEVVGVPKDGTLEMLVEAAAEQRYTRFPVYENTLDNIVGVVHVKDLFRWLGKAQRDLHFSITEILRPVIKVPETVLVEDLLTQMQTKQVHLTVVIDEYGGTAGIVTLEDILEEIVGEVQDEFDTREEGARSEVEILADGTSSVDGLMAVQDFADRFGVELDETDYETVAGYVFGELGRTPGVGDTVEVGNYLLTVEEMDNLRIARLKVEKVVTVDPDMDETEEAEEETTPVEVENKSAKDKESNKLRSSSNHT